MTTPDAHTASKANREAAATSSAPAGGPASARATAVQASNDWWQQHDQRVYQCIKLWVEQWWEPQHRVLIDAVGEMFGQHRASVREAMTKLKERVIRLETVSDFEERFNRLASKIKQRSEIPQSELLSTPPQACAALTMTVSRHLRRTDKRGVRVSLMSMPARLSVPARAIVKRSTDVSLSSKLPGKPMPQS